MWLLYLTFNITSFVPSLLSLPNHKHFKPIYLYEMFCVADTSLRWATQVNFLT